MKIAVNGLDDLRAALPAVQDQLPFATADALTKVANKVRDYEKEAMPAFIHKPSGFTKKGITTESATKATQRSRVYIQEIQAEYLQYQIEGGTRYPKSTAIPVPWAAKLTPSGNMPKGYIQDMLNQGAFSATIGGTGGIWTNELLIGGTLQLGILSLLVAWEPKAEYEAIWPFDEIAENVFNLEWKGVFETALQNALDTAK